jgi:tRNA pseudouridine55 synthase
VPGKFTTFDALKEGRKEEVLSAMYSLYDVSKLRGA